MTDRIARTARCCAVGTIVLLAVAFVVVRPPVPPGPYMRDFEPQYAAGATYAAGLNPYAVAIWAAERTVPGVDPRHEELLPFVGAPVTLPLAAALARLPYLVAAALWSLVIAAAVATILLGAFTLAGGRPNLGNLFALVALCIGFTPLISGISLGQEVLPALAGVVAASWLANDRRAPRWTRGVAASLCGFKPTIAALLVPLLFRRRWSGVLVTAAALIGAGCFLAVHGMNGIAAYLAALRGQGTAERFDVIQFTPFAIAYDFGLGPRGASAVSISLALAALLIAAWTIRERRRTDVESVALAAAAFPLVCPFLHAHDLSVTLLPGLLCVVRARGAAWLAAACGLLLVGGGWFGFSQGLDGLGFTLGLFLVAVFAVIALAGPAVGLVRLAPLGLVPLALAYGWFAIAHPITFWPAALPSGFAVPGHPAASVVWEIEQRVNGLERPDAWWASLRAVSLAGSAMLFGAMVALLRPERALERRPRMLAWLLVEG